MPPPRSATAEAAVARVRHENERALLVLVLLTVGVSGLINVWRFFVTKDRGALVIEVVIVLVGVYYADALRRARRGPAARAEIWFRATFEVLVPTVVILIDLHALGAMYAFVTSAAWLYVAVVALSALRIDRGLSVYTSALAIGAQYGVYLVAHDTLQLPTPLVAFRYAILALAGSLGVIQAHTLRGQIARAEEETTQRERVRAAFGSYVDARVVKRVLEGDLKLLPERRTITVMFVDIRGFTRFSESRDPAEVFGRLDAVLDRFAAVVGEQGGIVNKYLGDGLMAFFGAPEDQPDHSRRAVRAAVQIVAESRAAAADGRFPDLKIGIGIHRGPVIVGDLGSTRREYTAIGDVVNVASRVESANKELGSEILVTADVAKEIGEGAVLLAKPPLAVRGRAAPIEVFEVTGLHDTTGKPAASGVS